MAMLLTLGMLCGTVGCILLVGFLLYCPDTWRPGRGKVGSKVDGRVIEGVNPDKLSRKGVKWVG